MKKSTISIIAGLLVIALGVFYAGSLLGYWNFSINFDGWWTLFIILPCVCSMGTSGINLFNSIGTGVGILLFLNVQEVLPDNLGVKLIAPYCIIIVGLCLILRKPILLRHNGFAGIYAANDGDNYYAVFGGNSPRFDGTDFRGANAYAIFGGVCFRLKDAIIKRDCTIFVYSIFGSTYIHLPDNVRVLVRSIPVFGSVSNKFTSAEGNAPTVYVRAVSVFGTTEIQ